MMTKTSLMLYEKKKEKVNESIRNFHTCIKTLAHFYFSAPTPNPIARKSLFERSRCDTSLGLLTQRFAEMLSRSADGVLDLNLVAQQLNAPKRRVYDVTNVLEGIHLIKKKSKNFIEWL